MCGSDSPIKAQLIKFIELAGTCITKLTAKTTFQMTHEQHELNIVAMRSVENHARKQLAHQHTQYATEHLSEYSEECSVTPYTYIYTYVHAYMISLTADRPCPSDSIARRVTPPAGRIGSGKRARRTV